jgi:hypothetical protein
VDAVEARAEQAETELHYWRLRCFGELGYPRHLCEVLELADADWHELRALLDAGCSPELALEILT